MVPPVAALAVALPVAPPLQSTLVCEAMDMERAVGCVIFTEAVTEQPPLSCMVTVYVPALKLETLAVVAPPGFHK